MTARRCAIGRARTVLVFGQGQAARAVVATIVAQPRRRAQRRRLTFRGPGMFTADVRRHLSETVLAVIDSLADRLALKRRPKTIEIAVVNLGAASASDRGLCVEGFSADAAVLLALLSVELRLAVPQDLAVTGHVASCRGDIRAVSGIPAKLRAALDDDSVGKFLYPDLDADASLQTLSPDRRSRAVGALAEAKGQIELQAIANVSHLLAAAVTDEATVHAALRKDFFEEEEEQEEATAVSATGRPHDPVDETAALLAQGGPRRFWSVLESRLLQGRTDEAQELLTLRAKYQVRRKAYPRGLGRKLLNLVRSVPPATRRLRLRFPLLARDQSLKMCRFALAEDAGDVRDLMDACLGTFASRPDAGTAPLAHGASPAAGAEAAVDAVLVQISAEALARKVGLAIDAARGRYVLSDVTTDSYDTFHRTVSAFVLTLLRHSGTDARGEDEDALGAEAVALLERAFEGQGGIEAAWAEARCGSRGGLRFVLDVLTEQFKTDQQAKHVRRVLKLAVDPLACADRVEFMRAFLQRMGRDLPAEVRRQPPERFARHWEALVQTYVQSMDRVRQLLRGL